jgi:hypothetical protein
VIVILVLAFRFCGSRASASPGRSGSNRGSRNSSPICPTYWLKLKKKWNGVSRINRTKRRLAICYDDDLSTASLAPNMAVTRRNPKGYRCSHHRASTVSRYLVVTCVPSRQLIILSSITTTLLLVPQLYTCLVYLLTLVSRSYVNHSVKHDKYLSLGAGMVNDHSRGCRQQKNDALLNDMNEKLLRKTGQQGPRDWMDWEMTRIWQFGSTWSRVGQRPMRSGIFVGVVAGVFNLCINWNEELLVQRQIKQKTLRGDVKLSETRTSAQIRRATPQRRGQQRYTPVCDWNSKCNQPGST